MRTKLLVLIAALIAMTATAQYYFTTSTIPATSPQYPGVLTNVSSTPQYGMPILTGGLMATNAVPAGTTNQTMWSPVLDIFHWNAFIISATCNQLTNNKAGTNAPTDVGNFTNYIFLYPSADGVNFDTNSGITIGPWLPPSGQSNAVLVTNISPSSAAGTLPRYWQLGFGEVGTNTVTNVCVQVFVRGVLPPNASP